MPVKLKSTRSMIAVLRSLSFFRGEITVFTSPVKATFAVLQTLLLSILSFQIAVLKVLWRDLYLQNSLGKRTFVIYHFNCHFSISTVHLFFFCIPNIFMLCLCLSLNLDYLLYFPVYLYWPLLNVITFVAIILDRSVVEFIFEQFQFPFCSFSCIALSLYLFLWAVLSAAVCCAEIQHLYLALV